MEEIKNEMIDDKIVQIKKLVIEQLKKSKDLNIEYRLCLDYLNNHKDAKYKEFMTTRTKKTAVELHKYASSMISDVCHWIYEELVALTEHQRADLLNDEKKMDDFLHKVNEYIGRRNNGVSIFGAKRD